jgi:PAS domain S-box-containing protein
LITANKAFAEMVNTPIDQLHGKDAYDLFPKEQAQKFHIDDQKVMQSGKAIMNIVKQFTDAEGKTRWASSSKVPYFDESGKVAGMVGVTIDITKRKKAEEELQEKNEQLKSHRVELMRKATELEAASRAKSEFLANMSHELRTPLNAVIGFSELMLDGIPGEINDEQRECVNNILDSGQHLLSLINDVLDLSKVESGRIELKRQNLDIADIISGVVQIMKPVLDKNRQEIEVNVMQGLPKVRGDKNRLEQILLNLLSNASKFTEQGGRMRIHVGREGDYCQVAVIDTGIGIKKEDQEHIFEAFIQGETLLDRNKQGTGLGLTLTRQFVETMGGSIWLDSEYGKGSTFIFTLPLDGEPLETSLGDKQSSYS